MYFLQLKNNSIVINNSHINIDTAAPVELKKYINGIAINKFSPPTIVTTKLYILFKSKINNENVANTVSKIKIIGIKIFNLKAINAPLLLLPNKFIKIYY